ncbi:MAG: putative lipopolysaccharide heptosyltransferase III [Rhodocyclaceae bacterium]|nr:putative lipopolysaccharide heptosyltransferase III [Rhodocyclaceae bacterium]MBX3669569.1 putative lipopolysaccharide heptosyltransferase III [Rhodocyclaceae bacterium]
MPLDAGRDLRRLPDAVPLDLVRRVLVVNLRHHGDVLLCSPLLTVLKNHVPECEVDALVYADTAPMLSLHPALAQLHRIDRGWKGLGPLAQLRSEWRLLSSLRARRYDLLIALTPHRRAQWLARLLKPRWSVAPQHAGGGKSWKRSFTHLVARPIATWRHTVECYLDALRRIGCQPSPHERSLCLVPGAEAEGRILEMLAEHRLKERGYIHVHPGSRWQFKCWPAAKVAELIDRLHALGWTSVLTAAPDAAEAAMIAQIRAAVHVPVVDLSGRLTLKELAALSARARLFVGVDSAPMHIAAAVDTPLVALFGPSGARQWGPWHVRAQVVADERHQCVPCGRDGCAGSKRSECLESLPVARVMEAVQLLLDDQATPPPAWIAHLDGEDLRA